jgi:formate hydrogenlyase transcriptional activator
MSKGGELSAVRLQQYQALLDISESISRHADLAALFRDLAERLRPVVPFDIITVLLHDESVGRMRLHILESSDPHRLEQVTELTPLESPGGWVWQTQRPLMITAAELAERFPAMAPVWRALGIESGYYLPLTTAQRRLGTINFASTDGQATSHTACDLTLLQQVARLVAVAVDNALNFQSAGRYQQKLAEERDRLQLVLEVNNAVVAHLDLRELFGAIAGGLRRVIPQDYASLALYDEARRQWNLLALSFPAGQGLLQEELAVPFAGAPASVAFTSRQPAVFDRTALAGLGSDIARRMLAEGVLTLCCVPLVAHGQALGTLNVGRLAEEPFAPAETGLLVQVASQVALAVANALAYRQIAELKEKLSQEKDYLEGEIRTQYDFADIVGASPAIRRVLRQAEVVAPTDTTVLIQGETGTGKELIARAIHHLSARRERTLVKINCAAIPMGLLESELFGHEKGAFTGAIARKVGRFELAHQGTLFLDEVGDIPLELQPKLLRVLQEQEFERLGSNRTVRVDVRVVAATNRNLAEMVAAREFRSDLFYRLNVFPLQLPPLRERREDIPLLVRFFLQRHALRLKKPVTSIAPEALEALVRYPWPGNVRELENFMERAVLLSPGSELQVPADALSGLADGAVAEGAVTLAEAEREHILRVLRQTNWVIGGPGGAAAKLGMKRTTLQSRMQKLGISRP